jgi:hypothetical protein
MKGQTNEEGSDRVTDIEANTASRRGNDESRPDGSRAQRDSLSEGQPEGRREASATMGALENKP